MGPGRSCILPHEAFHSTLPAPIFAASGDPESGISHGWTVVASTLCKGKISALFILDHGMFVVPALSVIMASRLRLALWHVALTWPFRSTGLYGVHTSECREYIHADV